KTETLKPAWRTMSLPAPGLNSAVFSGQSGLASVAAPATAGNVRANATANVRLSSSALANRVRQLISISLCFRDGRRCWFNALLGWAAIGDVGADHGLMCLSDRGEGTTVDQRLPQTASVSLVRWTAPVLRFRSPSTTQTAQHGTTFPTKTSPVEAA